MAGYALRRTHTACPSCYLAVTVTSCPESPSCPRIPLSGSRLRLVPSVPSAHFSVSRSAPATSCPRSPRCPAPATCRTSRPHLAPPAANHQARSDGRRSRVRPYAGRSTCSRSRYRGRRRSGSRRAGPRARPIQRRARRDRRAGAARLLRQPPLGPADRRPPPVSRPGRAARRRRRGQLRPERRPISPRRWPASRLSAPAAPVPVGRARWPPTPRCAPRTPRTRAAFGHVFVICLDGCRPRRSWTRCWPAIRTRLGNEPDEERAVAADELRRLARGRLARLRLRTRRTRGPRSPNSGSVLVPDSPFGACLITPDDPRREANRQHVATMAGAGGPYPAGPDRQSEAGRPRSPLPEGFSVPAGTLYRGREGMWSWVAHRVTGVLIFFFLFVHVLDTALVRVSPEAYDEVDRDLQEPDRQPAGGRPGRPPSSSTRSTACGSSRSTSGPRARATSSRCSGPSSASGSC